MRKISEYNLLRFILFFGTTILLGGAVLGLLGRIFEVNLFEIYFGLPAFLYIALIALTNQFYLKKYDKWLTM